MVSRRSQRWWERDARFARRSIAVDVQRSISRGVRNLRQLSLTEQLLAERHDVASAPSSAHEKLEARRGEPPGAVRSTVTIGRFGLGQPRPRAYRKDCRWPRAAPAPDQPVRPTIRMYWVRPCRAEGNADGSGARMSTRKSPAGRSWKSWG